MHRQFPRAVLLSAVLSGVEPVALLVPHLEDVKADVALGADDVQGLASIVEGDEGEEDVVHRLRRLSTNSTGGLETGEVAAIVFGGVAVLILLVGAAWWAFMRNKAPTSGAGRQTFVRRAGFAAFGASADACEALAGDAAVEMPLLRLNAGASGAQ